MTYFCYKACHGYFLQVTHGQGQTIQESCSGFVATTFQRKWTYLGKFCTRLWFFIFPGIALTTKPHQLLHQKFLHFSDKLLIDTYGKTYAFMHSMFTHNMLSVHTYTYSLDNYYNCCTDEVKQYGDCLLKLKRG